MVERTLWAQRTEALARRTGGQTQHGAASRWMRLGRSIGLGTEARASENVRYHPLAACPALPFSCCPRLLLIATGAIAVADLIAVLRKKQARHDSRPSLDAASVVIPNWNGRELLAKYLPSVLEALAGNVKTKFWWWTTVPKTAA